MIKKKFYKYIIIFFSSLGVIMTCCVKNSSITDYSGETFNANSGVSYSYTIYRDLHGVDNNTVLYYFHGSYGDDTSWVKSHAGIIKAWRKSGKPSPVVIGISFGQQWLLIAGNTGKVNSNLLEIFIKNILPTIEKQINSRIQKRYVMGISMGGYNAAQVVFRYPELFEKGVILSPIIYPLSIYSEKKVIDEFITSENSRKSGLKELLMIHLLGHDILKDIVYEKIGVFQNKFFKGPESWNQNDILKNITKSPFTNPVKIYISCGNRDENGFYPGAEMLAAQAKSQLYDITWRSLNGGHMVIDEKDIADFLMQ